jgi:hypothetical protein
MAKRSTRQTTVSTTVETSTGTLDTTITTTNTSRFNVINVGSATNAKDGDSIRVAFMKVNENFLDVYTTLDAQTGEIGSPGLSAYEIAVQNGFVGTEQEWLASLKGEDGADGQNGTNGINGVDGQDGIDGIDGINGQDGLSAYEIALANGFVGTEQQWLDSLKGLDGVDGQDGADGQDGTNGQNGLSAYETALANGFVGTEQQWLDSLKGLDGINGQDGADGTNGQNGLSAYQIAVDNGFVGTEQEWLDSLKGLDGIDGQDGADGTNGTNGISAYEVAVLNGFAGTEPEWLESLKGLSAYQIAVVNGFVGTEQEWLDSLQGQNAGPTVYGNVFITNVNPTTTGNVGLKVFSSDGKILQSCVTDTELVTVSILAKQGVTSYTPGVTVNGSAITLTEQANGSFTGTIAIDLNGASTITAIHEDGPIDVCAITIDTAPVILSATFTGGYPGTQTELKAGDTFSFTVETDSPFVEFAVENYGAFNAVTATVASTTSHTFVGTIANRGTTVQSLGAKIRVKKHTGAWSEFALSETAGSVDGTNLVKLNNLFPSVSFGTITYPVSQSALKNSESATVANTILNSNTVVYDSPNSELTITNPTTLAGTKTVTRLAGTYNITTANLRATATRTANNATASGTTVVRIANVSCTVTVTEPAARLRSDVNPINYIITITSDQDLISAPTLQAGASGIFQNAGFTGSARTWTRPLQITNSMQKGTFDWGAISATNLAGIATTVISGNNNYTVGGFVSRTVTLAAYANTVSVDVTVTDYSKFTMTWSVKALPNKRAVGTTTVPDPNSWTIDALNVSPTTIRILDLSATDASSVPTTITIQESV